VLNIVLSIAVVLLTARLLLLRRRSSQPVAAPAAAAAAAVAAAKKSFPLGPLTIVWGSQTGTAEGFAGELMRDARRRGFNARSIDIEEYDHEELCDETNPIVLLMATNGEGEPTDNAIPFYQWANSEERGVAELGDVKYAVFALGNTQYEHYCFMGKWAHRRLGELGAQPLCEVGLGDDDDDIRADFEKWTETLWETLGGDDGEPAEFVASFDCKWHEKANGVTNGVEPRTPEQPQPAGPASASLAWLRRAFPKFQLLECRTTASRELTADPLKVGSVAHVELGVQPVTKGRAPLKYEGADDLGVYS
jgi:NADPH-ferrihemoprotein reductase